jgi:hypothetical protein
MLVEGVNGDVLSVFESESSPMRFPEDIGVINSTPYIKSAHAFSIEAQKIGIWVDFYLLCKPANLIWHDDDLRLSFSDLELRSSNKVQHAVYFDGYMFSHRFPSIDNKYPGHQWIVSTYDDALNANISPQLMSSRLIGSYDELSSGPPETESGKSKDDLWAVILSPVPIRRFMLLLLCWA